MITKHSIDLCMTNDPCFALTYDRDCKILIVPHTKCGTHKCPFYKPMGCKDWIREEDGTGVNLIPPEDWLERRVRLMKEWRLK